MGVYVSKKDLTASIGKRIHWAIMLVFCLGMHCLNLYGKIPYATMEFIKTLWLPATAFFASYIFAYIADMISSGASGGYQRGKAGRFYYKHRSQVWQFSSAFNIITLYYLFIDLNQ